MAVLLLVVGVVAMVVAAVVVVPRFLDQLDGPRFGVPGAATVDLDTGTWVLYERTGTERGGGNVSFTVNGFVTIAPTDVVVDGPAPVRTRAQDVGYTETITRGQAIYTGAVRFDVEQAGRYEIRVLAAGEPSRGGEVLVARPISELFSAWPWFVTGIIGSMLAVVGFVLWLIGAGHRRAVARAVSAGSGPGSPPPGP